MKRIGVIPNFDKDRELKYTSILLRNIIDMGGHANTLQEVASRTCLGEPFESDEKVLANSDIAICLGGDGTFLDVARKAYIKGIPMLGINLGNLGFLTEVEKNDIPRSVERILKGRYEMEERMMLHADIITRNGTISDIALNDIVVSRGALSKILHLKAYINEVFVDSFPGDGVIVSSPTGSTAYSLSAGGPIVEPDTEMMIISPICPHILYSRSFIATSNRVVKVVIDESCDHEAMVTVDGKVGYEVTGGDVVQVKKSQHSVKIIKLGSSSFFNILRTKIYDRGESLKKNEI